MHEKNESKWKRIFPIVLILVVVIIIASVISYTADLKKLPGEYIKNERAKLPIDFDYIWYPSFNKAGNKIIFEGYNKWISSFMSIYIWDLINESISRIPSYGDIKYPKFSNNEKYIVYSSDENGTYVNVSSGKVRTHDLWTYDMDTNSSKQITSCGYLYPQFATFSDNDQTIFFSSEILQNPDLPSHIYKINIDGTNMTQLTNSTATDWDPIPLSDNRLLLMSAEKGDRYYSLYTFDMLNGSTQKIIDMQGYYPSTDKNQNITFQSDKNIYSYNLTNKKLYRFTNNEMIFACPSVDHSGTRIVICGKSTINEPYHLYVINL